MAYRNEYEEEDDGLGLGTLGLLAGGAAMATPLGRRAAGRLYDKVPSKYRDPFDVMGYAASNVVSPMAAKAARSMTAGGSDLAARSWRGRTAAANEADDLVSNLGVPNLERDWALTKGQLNAAPGTVADFFKGTKGAYKAKKNPHGDGVVSHALRRKKEGYGGQGESFLKNAKNSQKSKDWDQFKASGLAKGLNKDELNLIAEIFSATPVESPMEAAMLYLRHAS